MRNIKNLSLFFLVMILSISGCKKEIETITSDWTESNSFEVTDQQVLEMIEEALNYSRLGFSYVLEGNAQAAENYLLKMIPADSCGEGALETYSRSTLNGEIEYNIEQHIRLDCDSSGRCNAVYISQYAVPEYNDDGTDGLIFAGWHSGLTYQREILDSSRLAVKGFYTRRGDYRYHDGSMEKVFSYRVSINQMTVQLSRNDYSIISVSGTYGFNAFYERCWMCPTYEINRLFSLDFQPNGKVIVTVNGIIKTIDLNT